MPGGMCSWSPDGGLAEQVQRSRNGSVRGRACGFLLQGMAGHEGDDLGPCPVETAHDSIPAGKEPPGSSAAVWRAVYTT